ncbi:MAG TPA: L,D-transpeptidase family protein [Geobacterales bacterium]|nr:L,D-transpeptidase family protein [Geobacterales bacterium]
MPWQRPTAIMTSMFGRPFLLSILIIIASSLSATAQEYHFAPDETVIGEMKLHRLKPAESLLEVSRENNLGCNEVEEANPGLDPFFPGNGTVIVPTSWVLPELPANPDIVINLSEMRLYHFVLPDQLVTYPIGIGNDGTETPIGTFSIIEKQTNPPWRVPRSIKKENPAYPKVMPPGPDNPLGSHALRLSLGDVLIHGTNRPWGIGRKATHGCIRLYPEDIPLLYNAVPVGARVTIVRQPVKAGIRKGIIYLEVHRDPFLKSYNYVKATHQLLERKGFLPAVDPAKIRQAIREGRGYPVDVSRH